jgi:hypothetical protein
LISGRFVLLIDGIVLTAVLLAKTAEVLLAETTEVLLAATAEVLLLATVKLTFWLWLAATKTV